MHELGTLLKRFPPLEELGGLLNQGNVQRTIRQIDSLVCSAIPHEFESDHILIESMRFFLIRTPECKMSDECHLSPFYPANLVGS